MKKIRASALTALSAAMICGSPAFAMSMGFPAAESDRAIPAEARATAQAGLYQWINDFIHDDVPLGQRFVLDIQTPEQLKAARLGRGFAMKLVHAGQLMAGGALDRATRASDEWRFLVMVGEHAVGLADVRQMEGRYQMVGLGAKKLAADIEAILAAHPAQTAHLLRSDQAQADYLELPALGSGHALYAPLLAARIDHIATHESAANDHGLIDENALAARLRAAIGQDTGASGE